MLAVPELRFVDSLPLAAIGSSTASLSDAFDVAVARSFVASAHRGVLVVEESRRQVSEHSGHLVPVQAWQSGKFGEHADVTVLDEVELEGHLADDWAILERDSVPGSAWVG